MSYLVLIDSLLDANPKNLFWFGNRTNILKKGRGIVFIQNLTVMVMLMMMVMIEMVN